MPNSLEAKNTSAGSNPYRKYRLEVIQEEKEFILLAESWSRLHKSCSNTSIFTTFEWMYSAWQWKKNDSRLLIFTIYQEDELVGLCPFVIGTVQVSFLTLKSIEFLTVPDTQSCELLILPDATKHTIKLITQWLIDHESVWDTMYLAMIPQSSDNLRALNEDLNQSKLYSYIEKYATNYSIQMEGDWESYYKTRSRRFKKGNNLVANKLKKAGQLELHCIRTIQDFDSLFASIVKISAASWKKGTGTTLDQPGPQSFFRELTNFAAINNWLSIWQLKLNGEVIAIEYQLRYKKNIHALRADYDTNYSELSPGTYLTWKVTESLFREIDGTYYMGSGDNAYKFRWTEDGEPLFKMVAYSHSVRAKLARLYLRTCPPLKVFLKNLKGLALKNQSLPNPKKQ